MTEQFARSEIEQSIADRFERMAARHGTTVAVRADGHGISYAALNRSANRIAGTLIAAAPRAERALLLFEQGLGVLAAVLGTLKAGKAYVPLDPTHPAARLAEMLHDSEAGVIVSDAAHRELARQLAAPSALAVVDIDGLDAGRPDENLGIRVDPAATAYMLYTSGSTGKPKGVVQRHRNLLHFVRSYTEGMGITPADRIAWLHSMAFSASNMNVYPALLNGATLCPHDVKTRGVERLADLLRAERVTLCQCVPTVFRHFLAGLTSEDRFPDLRIWELGGEPVFPRDVELFRRHFPARARLVNRLALTEASVAARYVIHHDTPLTGGAVPVGAAADGVTLSLLSPDGHAVPQGDVGEIVLRSEFLSPGYWKRPELTARVFQQDPDRPEQRTYRTGDLGRFRPDGLLEYFGRKDFRVKVRGYTVEVAEIEAALLDLGTVEQVVVVAREDRRGDQRLVAYVVPASETPPAPAELRASLAGRLPDYMVPSAFVSLQQLPVTATGKVDRLALPAPEESPAEPAEGYVAPRTPTEQLIAGIWAEVFGVDRIGIHDDFFALGGHSLLASRVVARLRRSLEVDVPLSALFEQPTVAELATAVGEALHPPDHARLADAAPR